MFNWFKKLFKKKNKCNLSIFSFTTYTPDWDVPVFVDFAKEKKPIKKVSVKKTVKKKGKK